MHHESRVLAPPALRLLQRLGPLATTEGFALVGGTALAIQIGHRQSIDLDFFGRERFDEDALLEKIERLLGEDHRIQVIARAEQTLNLVIDSVKVDLIRHRYPLLDAPITGDGYAILSKPDIAAMKLSAITNRGSRKDFYDLYFLLEEFSLAEMLDFYRQKYEGSDTFFVVRSLVYFDDAELEPSPVLLSPLDWKAVKRRIADAVRQLSGE